MGDIILKTVDLTKKFGVLRAVDRVSLEIEEKSIQMIIGPNGSGKTTLINCVSRLLKPDEGRIFFRGIDVTDKPPHEIVKLGLGRTFQTAMPFSKMSIMENMLVSSKVNPGENVISSLFRQRWLKQEGEDIERAFKVLELLGLDHLCDAPANELSGGQLKLLELGRLMMMDIKMGLLDEPIGSINPVLAHEIFSTVQKLRSELGVTFLVVEHRIDIALKYVDYAYAMGQGRIISRGTPKEVMQDPAVLETYIAPRK